MKNSISDLEKSVRSEKTVHQATPLVMDDALIGVVKKNADDSSKSTTKLNLAIVGAVAALVAVPITYLLTFDQIKTTSSALIRLTLLSPAIFVVIILLLFSLFWLMLRWFSLWFVLLIAGIVFISTCLYGFTSIV